MLARLVAMASAGLLVLGACGSAHKEPQAGSHQATTTAPTATVTTSPAAGPTTTAHPAGPTATTRAGSGPATTAKGAGGATATSAAPTAAPGQVGARPGRYVYDVSGAVASRSTLTVDPPSGSDQRSTVTPQGSSTPQSDETFGYTASQILFVDLKVPQIGKEFQPVPPVQASPVPAQVGQRWSWDMTSTDRTTTLHGDFAYTGTDTVTVGGQPVPVLVLSVGLTFRQGATTTTNDETEWVSTQLNLQLKVHDDRSGTTLLLESTTPA